MLSIFILKKQYVDKIGNMSSKFVFIQLLRCINFVFMHIIQCQVYAWKSMSRTCFLWTLQFHVMFI